MALVIIGFCSALAAVFSMVAVFRTAKATEKICSLMDTISEREKTFDITNRKKEAYYQLMGNRYSMVNEIGKSHILSEQREMPTLIRGQNFARLRQVLSLKFGRCQIP